MNHRLIAGLTSAIMSMNMLTILPMQAFALGTEITVYEKGCTIFGTPKFTRALRITLSLRITAITMRSRRDRSA